MKMVIMILVVMMVVIIDDGDYDDGGNDGCDNDDDSYDGDDFDLSLCDPVPGELDNGKIATTNRCLDLVEPNPAK